VTELRPPSHRRAGLNPRWLAAGGAVVLAGIIGLALLLQNGGSACASPPATSAHSGKATFYDLDGGAGNCSLPAPADDLFVALGPDQYSSGAACGTYLDVTGPKGKVRVKVIDSCPGCAAGHLDLSRTAFKKIGAEVDGIIPINYKTVVNPAVPGPLSVQLKDGSSQYWFAALIDNHGNELSSVKVAGPSGTFHTAERTDYDFWIVDRGAGSGPFKIKITDVYGRSATLAGITMTPGKTQKTSVRFTGQVAVKAAPPASPKPAKKKSASPSRSASTSAAVPTRSVAVAVPGSTTAPADPSLDLAGAATSRCR
jgi:expansin (peptidoglycan-binding protein)